MKQISTLVMAALALTFTACNNQSKPAAEAPAKKTVVSLPPYQAMLVQHKVADFDKWLPAFKSSDSMVKTAGLTQPAVGRGLENDKFVLVFAQASDLQKAKDFSTSQGLKDAMAKSGVTDTPAVSFWNVSFDDTSTIPQQERLMVTHHVKDFDTWKKAFDAEGDSVRAANGLVERLLARSTDEANTVTILFAITDMGKAKARVSSADLQKIMTDAGVDGPPSLTWFKWVPLN
jgi:hypothetical protein